MPEPRWRSVGDFLADLPRFHCSVKPPHGFCTVCLRINPGVASDCPLRFPDVPSAPVRAGPPRAQGDFYPRAPPAAAEAEYGAMRHERVPAQAVLPDAPVIEFARSTEPHQPRKRMKARAVQKRSAAEGEGGGAAAEDPQRRRDADGRVWATHEDAAGAPAPQPAEDEDARVLREWDPEAGPAPARRGPPRPPRPPAPTDESGGA